MPKKTYVWGALSEDLKGLINSFSIQIYEYDSLKAQSDDIPMNIYIKISLLCLQHRIGVYIYK